MAVNPAVRARGIERYVIVCGHRDEPKGAMLRSVGLAIERYWLTAAPRTEDASPISDKVRKVVSADLPRMAALTGEKQRDYPEIVRDNALVLVYAEDEIVKGYAHSLLVPAPAVYDPGGLTCLMTELVVEKLEVWPHIGSALLRAMQGMAQERGAVQVVVVCAATDSVKQHLLAQHGLTIASDWYVGTLKIAYNAALMA